MGLVPAYTLVDPVTLIFSNKSGAVTDTVVSARTTGSGALSATDTFQRRDWKRWTHAESDADGRKIAERVYHTIPCACTGLEGIGQDLGEPGTNFDETTYGYDLETNRLLRTVTPGGTIARTVFDGIRRVASSWVGTHDVPAGGTSWRDWSPSATASGARRAGATTGA